MWFDMEVYQGTDYEVIFMAVDPETGVPLDIRTGFSYVGVIAKTTNNGETPLYTWPVSNQGLVPGNGTLTVRIPGGISGVWAFERVVYGIKVIRQADSSEIMGIRGPLNVIPTVA
jgi:hypothetical protein